MTDLQDRFETAAESLLAGPPPIAAIRERGVRLQRRRRRIAAVGGAAVLAAAVVLAASLRSGTDRAAEPVSPPSRSCPPGAYVLDGDVDALAADCTATTVAHDVGDHAVAALSPDGTTVAYSSYADPGIGKLHIVDLGSGLTGFVVGRHDLHVTGLSWSPDSQSLAYTGDGLHVVDVGSLDDRVLDRTVTDRQPAWSPDGASIAFVELDTGLSRVAVFELQSGQVTLVTGSHEEALPAWSPDGIRLLSLDLGGQTDGPSPGVTIHRVNGGRELARTSLPAADVASTSWVGRPTLVSEPNGRTVTVTSYDERLTDAATASFTVPEPTQPHLGRPANNADLQGTWTLRFAGSRPEHMAMAPSFDLSVTYDGDGFSYRECNSESSVGLSVEDGAVQVPGAAASVPASGDCILFPQDQLPGLMFQVANVYVDGDRLLMTSITGHVLLTLTRA